MDELEIGQSFLQRALITSVSYTIPPKSRLTAFLYTKKLKRLIFYTINLFGEHLISSIYQSCGGN